MEQLGLSNPQEPLLQGGGQSLWRSCRFIRVTHVHIKALLPREENKVTRCSQSPGLAGGQPSSSLLPLIPTLPSTWVTCLAADLTRSWRSQTASGRKGREHPGNEPGSGQGGLGWAGPRTGKAVAWSFHAHWGNWNSLPPCPHHFSQVALGIQCPVHEL